MKKLIITEKPSVATDFMKTLDPDSKRNNGYFEGDNYIITWCIGHLITLCMPEAYNEEYAKWRMDMLPFIPKSYKYEVISDVKEQFKAVKQCLNRNDIDTIYYAGDAAREGEYIQRLVRAAAGRNPNARELRVWIDSQTEEEINRGIKEAKPISSYDRMSDSGYMRAIEDYLIGINFSRALSIKYGQSFNNYLQLEKYTPISVGRVMTCVLGMVVDRERQIRDCVETPYYGITAAIGNGIIFKWKASEESQYNQSSLLFKADAFSSLPDAEKFAALLTSVGELTIKTKVIEDEAKTAPLLFNLAELQSECSKQFKISPDETLTVIQTLYDKKLATYPRTDARVLSTAIAKEINRNISGLSSLNDENGDIAEEIIKNGNWEKIINSKYTDDSKVSDHYAIIPTGKVAGIDGLSKLEQDVYYLIVKRFLSIFLPKAIYKKITVIAYAETRQGKETFSISAKYLDKQGYLEIYGVAEDPEKKTLFETLSLLKEGTVHQASFDIVKGTTSAPARYNSGSMILAMENAGNLIEDEDLRAQIKSSGIGTSATRAETIKKLIKNGYIALDKKTQVIRPTAAGEVIYEIVRASIPSLLSPRMTASWEKGLSAIVDGKVTKDQYNEKLNEYVEKEILVLKSGNVLTDIKQNISLLKKTYKEIGDEKNANTDRNSKTCPLCGRKMYKKDWGYGCTGFNDGCNFRLFKSQYGIDLTEGQIDQLLEKGKTSKITLKKKAGGEYKGRLVINKDTGKINVEF